MKEPIMYTEAEVRQLLAKCLYRYICNVVSHSYFDIFEWFNENKKK